ncbi:MAG: hypothetical protein ACRYE7_02495 [Janthinobacterium lividum]
MPIELDPVSDEDDEEWLRVEKDLQQQAIDEKNENNGTLWESRKVYWNEYKRSSREYRRLRDEKALTIPQALLAAGL